MLDPLYYLPPDDLLDAVNDGELVFFVIGYAVATPFVLVEWAAGLSETDAIISESLYRDKKLLYSQSGNELRRSLADTQKGRTSKADATAQLDFGILLKSSAIEYGLSQLDLERLNDPSNFTYLKIL